MARAADANVQKGVPANLTLNLVGLFKDSTTSIFMALVNDTAAVCAKCMACMKTHFTFAKT